MFLKSLETNLDKKDDKTNGQTDRSCDILCVIAELFIKIRITLNL